MKSIKYLYETGFENRHDKGTVFDSGNLVGDVSWNINSHDLYTAEI